MILVDTSLWVDHLRAGVPALATALTAGQVLGHPWVLGELALGRLAQPNEVLGLLGALPQATVATDDEVMVLIARHQLADSGIGYVDAQLLAATLLTPAAQLWTGDRRLSVAAARLGVAATP